MLHFFCPSCKASFEEENSFLNMKVVCEQCGARFYVPANGETAKVAPPKKEQPAVLENFGSKIVISFDDPITASSTTPSGNRQLSPRQRRLFADAQMMRNQFASSPYVKVKDTNGEPPERYVIEYNVRGIERLDGEQIVYRTKHQVEIKLPGTYPRTPPQCKMLTPVFHPNIEPAVICIGDHWAAGERLCDLVVRIGEMITYQTYNIKSPLDGEAAMWTDLHVNILPIDNCDLMPPEQITRREQWQV